ncbi:MAG: hypothetical protein GT601_05905 [Acidaminobacter sp.]|uniref:hypothetical protein n=1 Tax=Acidaminobacter sp. TaxID=1872102 RepID=UPI0013839C35|nr:hypothetical protein [Acidaminobacter sp.]MZQ97190.1 hypothetical protein [Acidaminobacter sp.]
MNPLIRVLENIAQQCGPDEVFDQLMDNILSDGVYNLEALIEQLEYIEEDEIRAATEAIDYV